MIYTASFFNKNNHYGELVAISNGVPRHVIMPDKEIKILAPRWHLVVKLKDYEISWEDFKMEYLEHLERKRWDVCQIFDRYDNKDVTLLCWEKSPEKCHRRLLAEFLKGEGYEIGEIK